MDFQFDITADGGRLKFLNVIDEHRLHCLARRVGRRCKAKDVMAVLEKLISLYPAPAYIRSDNGPEFIGSFRAKFLNTEQFTTVPEAQLRADCWRWEYKTFRPHSVLQRRTPLEAAQQGAAA